MIVVGIDPGHTGAIAMFDSDTGELDIIDMPIWHQTIGRKKRARIDMIGIRDYFELLKALGCDLIVIEAVGGRPKQSSSASFVFGYGVGVIVGTLAVLRMPFETTPPGVWKRLMRVPVDDEGIATAFLERFPQHGHLIAGGVVTTGARKGKRAVKHGRAEAAMLAMFGAKHIQVGLQKDPVSRMVYDRSKIEVGA